MLLTPGSVGFYSSSGGTGTGIADTYCCFPLTHLYYGRWYCSYWGAVAYSVRDRPSRVHLQYDTAEERGVPVAQQCVLYVRLLLLLFFRSHTGMALRQRWHCWRWDRKTEVKHGRGSRPRQDLRQACHVSMGLCTFCGTATHSQSERLIVAAVIIESHIFICCVKLELCVLVINLVNELITEREERARVFSCLLRCGSYAAGTGQRFILLYCDQHLTMSVGVDRKNEL